MSPGFALGALRFGVCVNRRRRFVKRGGSPARPPTTREGGSRNPASPTTGPGEAHSRRLKIRGWTTPRCACGAPPDTLGAPSFRTAACGQPGERLKRRIPVGWRLLGSRAMTTRGRGPHWGVASCVLLLCCCGLQLGETVAGQSAASCSCDAACPPSGTYLVSVVWYLLPTPLFWGPWADLARKSHCP